jgi:hypothetical protein
MRRLMFLMLIVSFLSSSAFAQGLNKIVFGPLEGDDAGVLTVHDGEDIEIEVWFRTDPGNPGPTIGLAAGLMSDDDLIAQRSCVQFDPEFTELWDDVTCDGPYTYDESDPFPVTPGHTTEFITAFCGPFDCPGLDTGGDWLYAGSFLMTCNTGVEPENTYYPFAEGWFPHSGLGSAFSWEGGGTFPETDFCGLYFEPDQDLNKVVFGPLEGDGAGILTVRNGETVEVEIWLRTDPGNTAQITFVQHALLSDDLVISDRQGFQVEPDYEYPDWEEIWVDGPYVHNPEDNYPIPEGWTCEIQLAICAWNPPGDCLDTEGEWDLYGTWPMVVNTGLPIEQTYYPFADGWYPHSGQGTVWCGDGWSVVPETDFCGLYFESDTCIYIPGDVNRNGTPLELVDVLAMIESYRGSIETYMCTCTEGSPYLGFAATADPNGNCVANELGDVVTEMAAYRGTVAASGCPDCPGH